MIIIPEDPTCTSIIIDCSTYQHLTNITTSNPRQFHQHDIQQTKQNDQRVQVKISLFLPIGNEKKEDIDQETQFMLKRANQLRQEQQDQVKHLNESSKLRFS